MIDAICNKGYQWPASAITNVEMAILSGLREETGMPITKLLKLAVESFNIQTTKKKGR